MNKKRIIKINEIDDFRKIIPGTLLKTGFTEHEKRTNIGLYHLNLLFVETDGYDSDFSGPYLFKNSFESVSNLMFLGFSDKGLFFLSSNIIIKFRLKSFRQLTFPFDIKLV